MKYKVNIIERYETSFDIEANNYEEAQKLADVKWENQDDVPRTELEDTDIEIKEYE